MKGFSFGRVSRVGRVARALVVRAATAASVVAFGLWTASLALADTTAPPAAQESGNTVLLALVAIGALAAIILLNRPRRGGPR